MGFEKLNHIPGTHSIAKRVKTNPEKIQGTHSWRTPDTIEELQTFLGICNYQKKFLKDYSIIVRLLKDLLNKSNTNKK